MKSISRKSNQHLIAIRWKFVWKLKVEKELNFKFVSSICERINVRFEICFLIKASSLWITVWKWLPPLPFPSLYTIYCHITGENMFLSHNECKINSISIHLWILCLKDYIDYMKINFQYYWRQQIFLTSINNDDKIWEWQGRVIGIWPC